MNYCQVGLPLDGSKSQKWKKFNSLSVSGSIVESATRYMYCYRPIACARSVWVVVETGECHKVHVLLYSVCLDVIVFFNFSSELWGSGVSS